MLDVKRGVTGEVIIQVAGTFDARAAARLGDWLVEVPPDDPIVLDFTQARHCDDHGLASLAGELLVRERLVVRGLTRHQERLLRYLGLHVRGDRRPAGS